MMMFSVKQAVVGQNIRSANIKKFFNYTTVKISTAKSYCFYAAGKSLKYILHFFEWVLIDSGAAFFSQKEVVRLCAIQYVPRTQRIAFLKLGLEYCYICSPKRSEEQEEACFLFLFCCLLLCYSLFGVLLLLVYVADIKRRLGASFHGIIGISRFKLLRYYLKVDKIKKNFSFSTTQRR